MRKSKRLSDTASIDWILYTITLLFLKSLRVKLIDHLFNICTFDVAQENGDFEVKNQFKLVSRIDVDSINMKIFEGITDE